MKREDTLSRTVYVSASIVLSIVLWMAVSLLLFNGAMNIGNLIANGYFVPWQRIETPAGKIRNLRLGENGEVLLEMDGGRLFDWSQRSWMEIEKPSGAGPLFMDCRSGSHAGFSVRESPFIPAARIALDCFGPDTREHLEFALSPENEVWMWDWAAGDLSFFQYLPPFLGGLILSLICLLSLIVINIVLIRRKFMHAGRKNGEKA